MTNRITSTLTLATIALGSLAATACDPMRITTECTDPLGCVPYDIIHWDGPPNVFYLEAPAVDSGTPPIIVDPNGSNWA